MEKVPAVEGGSGRSRAPTSPAVGRADDPARNVEGTAEGTSDDSAAGGDAGPGLDATAHPFVPAATRDSAALDGSVDGPTDRSVDGHADSNVRHTDGSVGGETTTTPTVSSTALPRRLSPQFPAARTKRSPPPWGR